MCEVSNVKPVSHHFSRGCKGGGHAGVQGTKNQQKWPEPHHVVFVEYSASLCDVKVT